MIKSKTTITAFTSNKKILSTASFLAVSVVLSAPAQAQTGWNGAPGLPNSNGSGESSMPWMKESGSAQTLGGTVGGARSDGLGVSGTYHQLAQKILKDHVNAGRWTERKYDSTFTKTMPSALKGYRVFVVPYGKPSIQVVLNDQIRIHLNASGAIASYHVGAPSKPIVLSKDYQSIQPIQEPLPVPEHWIEFEWEDYEYVQQLLQLYKRQYPLLGSVADPVRLAQGAPKDLQNYQWVIVPNQTAQPFGTQSVQKNATLTHKGGTGMVSSRVANQVSIFVDPQGHIMDLSATPPSRNLQARPVATMEDQEHVQQAFKTVLERDQWVGRWWSSADFQSRWYPHLSHYEWVVVPQGNAPVKPMGFDKIYVYVSPNTAGLSKGTATTSLNKPKNGSAPNAASAGLLMPPPASQMSVTSMHITPSSVQLKRRPIGTIKDQQTAQSALMQYVQKNGWIGRAYSTQFDQQLPELLRGYKVVAVDRTHPIAQMWVMNNPPFTPLDTITVEYKNQTPFAPEGLSAPQVMLPMISSVSASMPMYALAQVSTVYPVVPKDPVKQLEQYVREGQYIGALWSEERLNAFKQALPASLSTYTVRVIPYGMMVTKEYNANRISIYLTERGQVQSIGLG